MSEIVRSTAISLSEDERENSIKLLNIGLANTLYAVLASKYAHWNVKGSGFFPAHLLFDKVYEFYSSAADILGERITALGGEAKGLINEVVASSNFSYSIGPTEDVEAHMGEMARMMGVIANLYRDGVELTPGDSATQDVFIELARDADKQLYFLESNSSA